jgi:hypothetical protein
MDKITLKKKISDLFIVRENDGSYNLFGKYTVVPENNTYKVNITGEQEYLHFSSLRNAVTWCVFDKNNKYKEVKRIHELDELISSLDVIIAQHTKLLEKTNNEDKYIYSAKLAEGKYKKKQALQEIEKYANISRYWQRKKFNENQDKNI